MPSEFSNLRVPKNLFLMIYMLWKRRFLWARIYFSILKLKRSWTLYEDVTVWSLDHYLRSNLCGRNIRYNTVQFWFTMMDCSKTVATNCWGVRIIRHQGILNKTLWLGCIQNCGNIHLFINSHSDTVFCISRIVFTTILAFFPHLKMFFRFGVISPPRLTLVSSR